MSSSGGLSRTRSLRKPVAKGNEPAHHEPSHIRNAARNVSPSRLPVKPYTTGVTASSTAPSSSITTSRTRAPSSVTGRQLSGLPPTRTSSRPVEHGATATTKPLGRAPSVRQAPSTTIPSTSSSRVASTARPKSSGGPPPTTSQRERQLGHSRAKSTATALTTATILRPLSHAPSVLSPSPTPSTVSSAASNTSTSVATTTTATSKPQTRSQTRHSRTQSQSQSQSIPPTTTSTLAARRPAFNTNQQHYSPAKALAPKPLTSTYLAPPSPSKQPVNVALTAETSRLQTELLQLSLLHREARAVSTSWHASARLKLGARFEELAAADRALRASEREGAEARGMRDLIRWGNADPETSTDPGVSGVKGLKNRTGEVRTDKSRDEGAKKKLALDEKIQLLDQVLNGVWVLGEPGGRYQRAVRAFEGWAQQVAEIRAAQRQGDVDALLARGGGGAWFEDGEEEGTGLFVSDLDAGAWKKDHAGLTRVLEGWRRMLAQLGDVPADPDDEDGNESTNGAGAGDEKEHKPRSGLARTLRGCRSLVHDMLAELKVMEQIEQDALAAEEEWMEKMDKQLRDDVDSEIIPRHREREDVPPWKLIVL
ncbi:hypothetical protein F5Y19DRAFT_134446 [Xylariaceae sp. FL1651]|nr:hypothetical protein F5Y19DRAFT_134446 [Xylariaceae sp. FL1651]